MFPCVEGIPQAPGKNNAQPYSDTKSEQMDDGLRVAWVGECVVACAGSGMPSARGAIQIDLGCGDGWFPPPSTSA